VGIPVGWDRLTVKPSAKPTLVRTQHLPLPAETARELGIPGFAGLLCLVRRVLCVPQWALRSSGYGHMVDGFPRRFPWSGVLGEEPPGSPDDHWWA
jgi:hypothetical protein